MKVRIIYIICLLLTVSCAKDEEPAGDEPTIFIEKFLPEEMRDYSPFLNPIVYNDILIVVAGDFTENMASLFKLNKDGEFLEKWDIDTHHYLHGYVYYFYENQLIYNSRYFAIQENKIVSVNLDNMTTNWELDFETSRSGLFGLRDKIYTVKYVSGGLEFYQIDLNTQDIILVHKESPVQYGQLVEAQVPYYYEIDNNNVGILVTSSDSSGFILNNFNITTQQMIWSISLNEFNEYLEEDETEIYASAPTEVQLHDGYIVVNSNSHISVRKLSNGDYIWSKDRMISHNVDMPVVGEGVIIDSTDKLFCYNIEDGSIRWKRLDKEDGIWVGRNDKKIIYKDYFFDEVPINIHNGEARWLKYDHSGVLDPDFSGKPGIDKAYDNLFYINSPEQTFYKVNMPE